MEMYLYYRNTIFMYNFRRFAVLRLKVPSESLYTVDGNVIDTATGEDSREVSQKTENRTSI